MSLALVFHFISGVIGAIVLAPSFGPNASVSFALGAGLSFFNLSVLVFAWPRILAKKLFALSLGIIVSKFAIMGWILYEVVNSKAVHLGWFSVGLGLVILSTITASLKLSQDSSDTTEG